MPPSISRTILHVRCSEHANSKSVQSYLTVDMSTPTLGWSLSNTSTHPIMVTQRSRSWSHPFHSMSISPHSWNKAISNYDLENFKVEVMGVVKGQGHTVGPISSWFALFQFHINQITIPEIQLFQNLTLKNPRSRSWLRSKVEVT